MTPWYSAGLAFECGQCGLCCTGEPGTVAVSETEIRALAEETGLATPVFRERYVREMAPGETVLRERQDGSCVLHGGERGCLAYAARPRQCATYPFWRTLVASRERWRAESRSCPGIGRGPVHSRTEIERISQDDGTLTSLRAAPISSADRK